jgi:CRISPR/Cas system CMR subunit Cmr4 (Cas7 group RAMP superfamily)
MFRDIFNGKKSVSGLFGGSILESETILEMHYISRSGSLEVASDSYEWDEVDTEEEEKRWHEDPLSGRLSAVDAALASMPCQLIDRHWQWVTTLDLSRNHIE